MTLSYEIRVQGRLSRTLLAELEELDLVASAEPVQTLLYGPVEDQAALNGLLRRIESFGLELVDVRRAAKVSPAAAGPGKGAAAREDRKAGHVPTT